MTLDQLTERLSSGGIVPLDRLEWEELAQHFPVLERHETQLAGELLVVQFGEDLMAVEAPSRDARVARVLGGPEEAEEFVAKRLEEYERMWDGCGVKVDYFGDS